MVGSACKGISLSNGSNTVRNHRLFSIDCSFFFHNEANVLQDFSETYSNKPDKVLGINTVAMFC